MHPAHEFVDMSQLNVVTDLMARIQEVDIGQASLENVLVTAQQESNLQNIYTWLEKLKIMVLAVIGFIFFLITWRICIAVNPFIRINTIVRRSFTSGLMFNNPSLEKLTIKGGGM